MSSPTRVPISSDGRLTGRSFYLAIAAALIGVFLLQIIPNLSEMSATGDEPIYIASGYSYWTTRDGRLNIEHTPLIKLLIALPLLPLRLAVPVDTQGWREGDEWAFYPSFMSRNRTRLDEIMFRSRLPIVGLGILLAVFVCKWAGELWGAGAGLIALLMFVLDPTIVAQSGLATLDLGFTTFTFIAMYYVWRWLRSGRGVFAACAAVALMLVPR